MIKYIINKYQNSYRTLLKRDNMEHCHFHLLTIYIISYEIVCLLLRSRQVKENRHTNILRIWKKCPFITILNVSRSRFTQKIPFFPRFQTLEFIYSLISVFIFIPFYQQQKISYDIHIHTPNTCP